jgi:hypothetical protein
MHRIFIFGIALFLICVHPLGATNPEDIGFRARLVKDTHAYHMGESIQLEIVYSSQSSINLKRSFVRTSIHCERQSRPGDAVGRTTRVRRPPWLDRFP